MKFLISTNTVPVMPKNPAAIRRQIADLQADLKAAEAEAEKKAERTITRAAKRSGLAKIGLDSKTLEREFRAIVRRVRNQEASDNPAADTPAAPTHDPAHHAGGERFDDSNGLS
jgi:hypothetical protein